MSSRNSGKPISTSAAARSAPLVPDQAFSVRRRPATAVVVPNVPTERTLRTEGGLGAVADAVRNVASELRTVRESVQIVTVPVIGGQAIAVGGWTTPPSAITVGAVRSASGGEVTLTAAPGVSWQWVNGAVSIDAIFGGLTADTGYILTLIVWGGA